jgi:hypothetical protein
MAKPGSLVDKYRACEPPPDLNKMNPYRDDNLVPFLLSIPPHELLRAATRSA